MKSCKIKVGQTTVCLVMERNGEYEIVLPNDTTFQFIRKRSIATVQEHLDLWYGYDEWVAV